MFFKIRLYGAFSCEVGDPKRQIKLGAKQAAIVSLLACAPSGRRTGVWLQDLLWPLNAPEQRRGSLRQAISALKRQLGDEFPSYFDVDHHSVTLRLERCTILGVPTDGAFLEGFAISGAPGFQDWIIHQRQTLAAGVQYEKLEISSFRDSPSTRLRPSLAVFPFVNVGVSSIDIDAGDLLASDLSRYLSRAPGIDVISHLSCRSPEIRQAGAVVLNTTFEIDHLVSGHVRDLGSKLLLSLEFTNVKSAKIVATKNFELSTRAVLEGHGNQINQIARFVAQTLFESALAETANINSGPVAAHTLLMSSIVLMHRQDLASVSRSRQQLENITATYGNLSVPQAWLAKWYVMFVSQGWSENVNNDATRAKDAIARAKEANPVCSFTQVIEGLVQFQLFKDFDDANKLFNAVINLDENNPLAWIMRGTMFAFEGRGKEAISFTERAQFLSPLEPGNYLFKTLAAAAYLADYQFERALELSNVSLELNPFHASSLRAKTVALHGLGRMDAAKETVSRLMRLEPGLTISDYLSNHAATQFSIGREWAHALRDSGVPKN